jgi:hypothetical protein
MGKLIDVDKFLEKVKKDREHEIYLHSWTADMVLKRLDSWYAPAVEAIPKDQINKAIEKIEQYICDVETDTVKAQGMAQALDMFEQTLGGLEDGNIH